MCPGIIAKGRGKYYAVMFYMGANGKKIEKWINLNLEVAKATYKKAQNLLAELKVGFIPNDIVKTNQTLIRLGLSPLDQKKIPKLRIKNNDPIQKEMATGLIPAPYSSFSEAIHPNGMILFSDFMMIWFERLKPELEPTTLTCYSCNIENMICPYFRERGIYLQNLGPDDLECFYKEMLNTKSANTVIHYHANIRKCLQYAYKKGYVFSNVADRVDRPKKVPYVAQFYNEQELKLLLAMVKGTMLEFGVSIAAYYGLRREEIVGLKWDAIDFNYKKIMIKHTVTHAKVDGKGADLGRNRTKSKSSFRTLPLAEPIEKMLLSMKDDLLRNKQFFKNSYNKNYEDYVYLWPDGNRVKLNWITSTFKDFLEKNNLKRIRFHDLRHSCATLMRHEGVRMEDIQKWLGHSTITTTEGIYAHYDESQGVDSMRRISKALNRNNQNEME